MRVVVNLLPTLKARTGVGHYAARLFDALRDVMPPDTLHAFPTGLLAAVVRRVHRARAGGPPGTGRLSGRAKQALRTVGRGCLGVALRAACRRSGYDLYHEPNFIPLTGAVPAVVTVHDLSVILHPEWHPADRVRHHERCFRRGLADARHVITVSHAVRREVIRHLGVPPDRVTAVYNGVGPEYRTAGPAEATAARQALDLPPDYLLFVGTVEPRKNVMTLLRAFCDLPDELRRCCPLVLAGGWGWKSADVADYYRQDAAAKGVIHLGYVDDRHLPGLYAGARALAYPSFYEGFGLPPLEMLACGGAVLASTADALREVLAGHAHYVEPLDVAGWRDALCRSITDEDWLDEIRRGGRAHAAGFTWERCASDTAAAYGIVPVPRQAAA